VKIITVSAEQDIGALARHLFAAPASRATRVSEADMEALVDANPHLAGLTTVPAGTPILIPDRPGLAAGAAGPAWAGTLDDIRAQAQEALAHARSVFEQAGEDAAREAKESLEVLRSREFKALAGAAGVNLESLTARVNSAAKDAQAQAKQDLKNLEGLSSALDELMKTIGGST
jgi:hypothetical protein